MEIYKQFKQIDSEMAKVLIDGGDLAHIYITKKTLSTSYRPVIYGIRRRVCGAQYSRPCRWNPLLVNILHDDSKWFVLLVSILFALTHVFRLIIAGPELWLVCGYWLLTLLVTTHQFLYFKVPDPELFKIVACIS